MSTFIFNEYTSEQAQMMAENGPKDYPNHIANLLKGLTTKNWTDYLDVKWDDYRGVDKKQDPRPTLKIWIKDPKNKSQMVRDIIITPSMQGKGFWGGTGNLGGSSVDALIPCEKQFHLNYKDSAAASKIVTNNIEQINNSIVAQSLFSTDSNVIADGKKHPDPSIDALATLERVAHFIIAEKCKEQADGDSDLKRIDDMTANYCSGKPQLVSKLGDKSKSLIFSYDRNDKKETEEQEWRAQTTMYRKASKKAKGKNLGGGIPNAYKNLFEESQNSEAPVHPFPFPMAVIAQEVEVDDDDDEPPINKAKTDKNGYIQYNSINLVNYNPQAKQFTKAELARLSMNDRVRRELGSRVHGIPILRITASQSPKCCAFQIKISNLAVGLRWDSDFGFSYRVEGVMPVETNTADTQDVNLVLSYAGKKRKVNHAPELDSIDEEDEQAEPDSPDSKRAKLSEEMAESEEEDIDY